MGYKYKKNKYYEKSRKKVSIFMYIYCPYILVNSRNFAKLASKEGIFKQKQKKTCSKRGGSTTPLPPIMKRNPATVWVETL